MPLTVDFAKMPIQHHKDLLVALNELLPNPVAVVMVARWRGSSCFCIALVRVCGHDGWHAAMLIDYLLRPLYSGVGRLVFEREMQKTPAAAVEHLVRVAFVRGRATKPRPACVALRSKILGVAVGSARELVRLVEVAVADHDGIRHHTIKHIHSGVGTLPFNGKLCAVLHQVAFVRRKHTVLRSDIVL